MGTVCPAGRIVTWRSYLIQYLSESLGMDELSGSPSNITPLPRPEGEKDT